MELAVYAVRPSCTPLFFSPIVRRVDTGISSQNLSRGSETRQVPFSQLISLRQSRTCLHRRSITSARTSAALTPNRSDVATFSSDATPAKSRIFLESEYPLGGEVDVVVVGSGLGGLCCAALLAQYGQSVVVCEAHTIPGGAAHSFVREGFHFDSGPSFHAGLSMKKSINPLKQVLDILGEEVPCVAYDTWIGYLPEGVFTFKADAEAYRAEIARVAGKEAERQFIALERAIAPLAAAAAALPASALRSDPWVLLTAARFLPALLPSLPAATQLLQPFSNVVDEVVTSPFLRNLIDLECFVLSGMLADSTITAEMAFMFFERARPEGTIDYPLGGGGAIVDALVRGLEKNGNGKLLLGACVQEIVVDAGGQATGVRVKGRGGGEGVVIKARKAVVSNASIWDTASLLSPSPSRQQTKGGGEFGERAGGTKQTGSFLHLHLGIDAAGLPPDLQCHHLIVNEWEAGIEAPQNVIIISIPSVFDPSLAPPGCHTVHCYSAGNEPYQLWEGMDRNSPEYKSLKEERVQALWRALEKVIPDIRQRCQVSLIGTPLTHERYLRRSRGSYGPAVKAGEASWPGPRTEVERLYHCGDSTMPGIGVPAVAASGLMTANAILGPWAHLDMLNRIEAAEKR